MAGEPEISIVVPAFNESQRLPGTLDRLRAFLDSDGRRWELVLVNDGSSDSTLQVVREAERRDPDRVRGVDLQPNGGKGPAVAAGVAASRAPLVLVSDADLSTPIEELAKLEAALDSGYDVAIGSRAKRGAQVELPQPFHRVLMGKVFNLIVQVVVLPGFWDTQCGFKLWKGPAAREVFGAMKLGGNVAFDVEVLYRARKRGYRIAEVPVRWIDSVPSRISPLRHSTEALVDIFKIRFLR